MGEVKGCEPQFATFSHPVKHETRTCSTFGKCNPSSTNAKAMRIYVRSFSISWFKPVIPFKTPTPVRPWKSLPPLIKNTLTCIRMLGPLGVWCSTRPQTSSPLWFDPQLRYTHYKPHRTVRCTLPDRRSSMARVSKILFFQETKNVFRTMASSACDFKETFSWHLRPPFPTLTSILVSSKLTRPTLFYVHCAPQESGRMQGWESVCWGVFPFSRLINVRWFPSCPLLSANQC